MGIILFNTDDENNPKYISFTKFILSESLGPVKTDFGTDLKNREWYESYANYYTFFKGSNFFHVIIIQKDGEIAFATKDKFTVNDKLKSFSYINYTFDFERRRQSEALNTFNKVFYIVIQGINKFNLPEFKFSAFDDKLNLTYSKMMKNKFFIKNMENEGFVPEITDDYYIFKRK